MQQADLEDNVVDILSKALRGQGLDTRSLARNCGLDEARIEAVLAGRGSGPELDTVAEALGLQAPALRQIASGGYRPQVDLPEGCGGWSIPCPMASYPDMRVNVWYTVCAPSRVVLFDAGVDGAFLIDQLAQLGLIPEVILITHTHHDHVSALPQLRAAFPSVAVFSPPDEPIPETLPYRYDQVITFGQLSITPRLTPGHSAGGTSLVVSGLAKPLAVVGDAIFAGSVGGIRSRYQQAIAAIRRHLLSLPPETVLLPGHGPATSVVSESRSNPFFANCVSAG